MIATASLLVALAQPVQSPTDPTAAIPEDYVLRWAAPNGCPTADDVRALVLSRHGPTTPGAVAAEIDGVVTGTQEHGFALVLTTRFAGDTHVRRMRASACAELGESTAIVIAVALDEGLDVAMADPVPEHEHEPEPVDEPAPAPVPVAEPAPSTASTPTRTPTPPRRPDGALRISGGGEIGALGVIAGALQLGTAVVWPRARAELHGIYLAPRVRVDAPSDSRATFQGGAVAARGCWVPPSRAVEIPLCAGVEAGTIRVDAPFAAPAVRHTRWAGALVGVAVLRAVGPVKLVLAVDAVARVAGSRFRIDDRLTFAQLPVSVRWLLGVEFRLARGKTAGRQKSPPDVDTTE